MRVTVACNSRSTLSTTGREKESSVKAHGSCAVRWPPRNTPMRWPLAEAAGPPAARNTLLVARAPIPKSHARVTVRPTIIPLHTA